MNEKDLVKSVGKALSRERKLRKMTQTQLADRLGIEKESVSRMETGVISPTLSRLQQISEVLNCPVRQFFWFESGDDHEQADTLVDMIRSLPEERRELIVRFVADLVRVLK